MNEADTIEEQYPNITTEIHNQYDDDVNWVKKGWRPSISNGSGREEEDRED